jgi:hypothetical protein
MIRERDYNKFQEAKERLEAQKLCPVCRKTLEPHPFGNMRSCFAHGDYEISIMDGTYAVMWTPLDWGGKK